MIYIVYLKMATFGWSYSIYKLVEFMRILTKVDAIVNDITAASWGEPGQCHCCRETQRHCCRETQRELSYQCSE